MTKAENGLGLGDDIDPEVELKRKKKYFVVKLSCYLYTCSVYSLTFFCVLVKLQFFIISKTNFFLHILTSLKLGYVLELLSAMWQSESWQFNSLIGSMHQKLEIGYQLTGRKPWRQ